jgi:hypothetical protein
VHARDVDTSSPLFSVSQGIAKLVDLELGGNMVWWWLSFTIQFTVGFCTISHFVLTVRKINK